MGKAKEIMYNHPAYKAHMKREKEWCDNYDKEQKEKGKKKK